MSKRGRREGRREGGMRRRTKIKKCSNQSVNEDQSTQ